MAEETKKEVAAETPVAPTPAVEAPTPVAEDLKADSKKTTVAPPPAEEKSDESKALAVVEKAPEPAPKKSSTGSHDRDVALADLEKEKKLSFIKAWEDSEKTKAENK
nr:hypothetical protein B456_008G118300 [Gossypium raimondii]